MVDNIKQQLNVLSNALRVRNQKQEILASNIANAATPNYKARDVNFEVELAKSINAGPLTTSNNGHIAVPSKNLPGKVQFRQSINPSVDGNTVELAVEQMEFSENVVRYQTTLQFLTNKISGLMSAIKGE